MSATDPRMSDAATRDDSAGAQGIAQQRSLRLLQIVESRDDARLVDGCLKAQLPGGSTIERVESAGEAIELLQETVYDAVLVDLSRIDGEILDTFRVAANYHRDTPIVDLSEHDDSEAIHHAMRTGTRDLAFKARLQDGFLRDALRDALAGVGTIARESTKSVERRSDPRYLVDKTALIFPIELTGGPGREIVASVVDISRSGIGLLAERTAEFEADTCLIGVETSNSSYCFATVQWLRRQREEAGLHLGGVFVSGPSDPFDESKLVPRLDTARLQLVPTIQEEILHQWTARGVLRPYMIDRVKTCPRCQALPTFRDGCARCGSARTASSQLIHHFACAHVAHVGEFEREGALVCPKCRARDLVVGADFEHLAGPHRCFDCDWSDTEPALIGECLLCGLRFPANDAYEREVIQFHVERLDPLALVEVQ